MTEAKRGNFGYNIKIGRNKSINLTSDILKSSHEYYFAKFANEIVHSRTPVNPFIQVLPICNSSTV